MKAINSNIIITSISSRKDGSLRLGVVTPELSPEERVSFMELQNLNVEALFEPIDHKADAPIEIKNEVGSKSQGQRIRNVLFILWKQEGEQGTFESYYQIKTEKYIEFMKDKIV